MYDVHRSDISIAALAVFALLLSSCSPPAGLDRTPSPPTAKASDLLPLGRGVAAERLGAGIADAAVVESESERMTARRYASPAAAGAALKNIERTIWERKDIASRSAVAWGAASYVIYSTEHVSGLAWTSGVWVFAAEAPTEERLTTMIALSRAGGLYNESERNFLRLFPLLVLVGATLGVAVIYILMRLALRASAVAPVAGIAPVSRADMLARLLRLNQPALPLQSAARTNRGDRR